MTAQCSDVIAYELAQAIARARGRPTSSAYTQQSMAALLRNHLATRDEADGDIFEVWQLREIAAACATLEADGLSLRALSQRCRLSPSHFARQFKARYGMPLHRYVVRLRIERARQLLRDSRESVCQIALRCGFAEQSSFTRRFTALVGMSPVQWRRHMAAPRRV